MQRSEKWGWVWLVVYSIVLLTGCGTLNDRRWGQDATRRQDGSGWARRPRMPSWIREVLVYVSLGSAFLIGDQIGHIDHKLSNWAADRTPVFGSQKRAAQVSDYLQDTARAAGVISALATPSGKAPEEWQEGKEAQKWEWLEAKGKGMLGVDGGAVLLTFLTNKFLKVTTHRIRPDKSDGESFPSGHASHTAVFATLASRNVAYLPWPEASQTALKVSLTALTVGTAGGRVEAKKHFPSDVLFGAALGRFFGAFINDALLGLNRPQDGRVIIQPSREGVLLGLRWPF